VYRCKKFTTLHFTSQSSIVSKQWHIHTTSQLRQLLSEKLGFNSVQKFLLPSDLYPSFVSCQMWTSRYTQTKFVFFCSSRVRDQFCPKVLWLVLSSSIFIYSEESEQHQIAEKVGVTWKWRRLSSKCFLF
jgi:hypothetical protein